MKYSLSFVSNMPPKKLYVNTYILKITIQNLKNYVQILCEIYKKEIENKEENDFTI